MKTNRRALLAKIHIGKKALGWDDDFYRAVLQDRYDKQSAAKLNMVELIDLVDHLSRNGVDYPNSRRPAPAKRPEKFYEIPQHVPFAAQKRWIAAMWCALGWKMSGLDVRVRKQFGVDKFLWIEDQSALQTLAKDLVLRCNRKGLTVDDLPTQRAYDA